MTPLFKKLNLKDQTDIVILNSPDSFEAELKDLEEVTIHRELKDLDALEFSLTFVMTQEDLDRQALDIAQKAYGDAVLWFAYPKGSSKKYQCEFNRDHGWEVLHEQGFEGVRQVAIDEDWSALRFRRLEYIKS